MSALSVALTGNPNTGKSTIFNELTGDAAVLGKATGSDIKNAKSTYVSLTSLEAARNFAREAVEAAVDALKIFGTEADFLRELVTFLTAREK